MAEPLRAVTNVGDLGVPLDAIDWSQLGPRFTTLISPFAVTTADGKTVTVAAPATGFFERVDQDDGWFGNFSSGTELVEDTDDFGASVTLTFASPVGGAGVQIQDAEFGSFTALITVNGTSTFSETGDSTGAADGSAIFIGWKGPITTIEFATTAPGPGIDLAIGPVSILSSISSVPETSTWAMMLMGFAGLGFAGYRVSRRTATVGPRA